MCKILFCLFVDCRFWNLDVDLAKNVNVDCTNFSKRCRIYEETSKDRCIPVSVYPYRSNLRPEECKNENIVI